MPSNFIFGIEVHLQNICMYVRIQGHRINVKVMAAKNSNVQVCAPLGHSFVVVVVEVFDSI